MARIQGDLKERTFRFALRIIEVVDYLPNNMKGWELGRQLLRSGTGIGANVREADNAHTDADFANKCSIARKEAGETHYWLEICQLTGLLPKESCQPLVQESDELTRVLSSIVQRTQEHLRKDR